MNTMSTKWRPMVAVALLCSSAFLACSPWQNQDGNSTTQTQLEPARQECEIDSDCLSKRPDACQDMACESHQCVFTPKTCSALDQCHDVGVCQVATGECTNPLKPADTACDDGNLCTTGDQCGTNGVCTGTQITCTALDSCHSAGVCDPTDGTCTNPALPDGTGCSDNDLCTENDSCQIGVCTGTQITCTALDSCHSAGVCDPTDGTCTNPALPDGTICTADNDACTMDTCQIGICTIGAPAYPGCCTSDDQCGDLGTSWGSNIPCVVDTDCIATPATPTCSRGQCVPVGYVFGCTVDPFWNPTEFAAGMTGACTTCRDADNDGVCLNWTPDCTVAWDMDRDLTIGCEDTDCEGLACADDGTCQNGECVIPVKPECVTSEDCVREDQCLAYSCLNGACVEDEVFCNDGNACTTDSCDPVIGCVFTNNVATCDGGTCQAGICVPDEPQPECLVDEDCLETEVCWEGSCVDIVGKCSPFSVKTNSGSSLEWYGPVTYMQTTVATDIFMGPIDKACSVAVWPAEGVNLTTCICRTHYGESPCAILPNSPGVVGCVHNQKPN